MPTKTYDYFIVGQGLAGSLLAYKLIQHGLRVCVFDHNYHNSASMVAAGIINPITGHRLNITEGFTKFQQSALPCYQALEKQFNKPFYHRIAQQRLIKNAGQFSYLEQRQQQTEYQTYLGEYQTNNEVFNDTPFGTVDIQYSAYVDVKAVLLNIKQWLIDQGSYADTLFDYQQLTTNSTGIQINQLHAKRLVFCEGHQATQNPWLSHLPFKLAKGEILTLETPSNTFKSLFNWGHWLLPTASKTIKLGSNYDWHDLSTQTTPLIKDKLLESLQQHISYYQHIDCPKIIEHQTGIRPTTQQRKPFIGPLSNLANAFCFNGFGSKGCLLIPYYTDLLIQHCEQGKPLPEELSLHL